jgi:hypothetical protein
MDKAAVTLSLRSMRDTDPAFDRLIVPSLNNAARTTQENNSQVLGLNSTPLVLKALSLKETGANVRLVVSALGTKKSM